MSTIGKRLRQLRKGKGWTLQETANRLGLQGHSTYSNWEYGRSEPDHEMVVKLAEVFDSSLTYIITGNAKESTYSVEKAKERSAQFIKEALEKMHNENATKSEYTIPTLTQFVEIPIYGEIKAGYDLIGEQHIMGYDIVARKDVEDGQYFYLIVKGESMIEEGIREGAKVLVRQQSYVENGKIGVVIVNGDEATLKRVFYEPGVVILQAANREIPPRIVPQKDVIIQGQVKSYTVDV